MSTSTNALVITEPTDVERTSPRAEPADVYNLMVLVRKWKEGGTSARAANLPLPEVQSETVREALASLVSQARTVISDCLAKDNQIPWIEPAIEPDECESRFMVPLHLH